MSTGDSRLEHLNDRERAMVEGIGDPEVREVITCSLAAHRRADRLAVGDPVPQLSLERLESEATVGLADFTGEKPLVLVFGSFT